MEDLVIVVSVTVEKCYKECLEKSLSKIGVDYTLIKTDPNVPFTASMNSVIKHENLHKSKYILFSHQDVEFLDEGWGTKIVELCDSLPDLGYAGTECITKTGETIGCGYNKFPRQKWGKRIEKPTIVETCDDGTAIIPTKLFLEKQFNEEFPFYPVFEDYACWIQFVKKLKVYAFPIRIYHHWCGKVWRKKFKTREKMCEYLTKEWLKLNKKWGRQIHTTSVN